MTSAQEMRAYARALARWLDEVVALGLAPAATLDGLGSVILDEAWRREERSLQQNYSIRTAANWLVLAALTRPERVDDWFELARRRFNRYRWRHRLDDMDGRYLDRPIDCAGTLARQQSR